MKMADDEEQKSEEEEKEEKSQKLLTKIASYIPAVVKPTYKASFNTRLMWTGVALLLYFVLSNITVFGVQRANFERFRFFEIVLGSRFGSLMTLGIGPIVTAGILLQLLVGSKIVNWDMSKPEVRSRFQTWNKLIAIILSFVEAAAYIAVGAVPVTGGLPITVMAILQLAAGGIIVILLDDLVSKWGFGSGISLFIAAGVGSQIIIRIISPLATSCLPGVVSSCIPSIGNPPTGLIWSVIGSILGGSLLTGFIAMLPIIATIMVFMIVVFIQDIAIDIPLAFSAMRGFGRTWSLKLLYTSNIPVILTAALVANLQLFGQIGLGPAGANGLRCGPLGCFDTNGQVVSGIIYYLTSPNSLLENIVAGQVTPNEAVRALTYLTLLCTLATIFSIFWVSTSGMDSESVAKQISSIGMHIPGYRSDQHSIKQVLDKYIPNLAVLGGFIIGLIAALADFTGAIGTGTGILLTVMIVYNYYEELSNQDLEGANPTLKKFLEG
jgi:preprotein translocase subunit SecY